MNQIKLEIAQTISQALENISEFLMNYQEESDLEGVLEGAGCCGYQDDAKVYPAQPEFIRDLPVEILDFLNNLREGEVREQGQETRLTALEKLMGLDKIPDSVKGMTNEEAFEDGILGGLEAALKKILGPSAKISRIFP